MFLFLNFHPKKKKKFGLWIEEKELSVRESELSSNLEVNFFKI